MANRNWNIQTLFCCLIFLAAFGITAQGQTTVKANRVIATDSVKIGSRWVYLVDPDSTFTTVSHRAVPTTKAVRDYILSGAVDSIAIVDSIVILYAAGTEITRDTLPPGITDAEVAAMISDSLATIPGTNLSFSGASSPVLLESSTGTNVSFLAGTGVALSQTGNQLTINNTGVTGTSSATTYLPRWTSLSPPILTGDSQYRFNDAGPALEVVGSYLSNATQLLLSAGGSNPRIQTNTANNGMVMAFGGNGSLYVQNTTGADRFGINGTTSTAFFANSLLVGGTTTFPARLTTRGSGTSSATYSFIAENSSGTDHLVVRDDGNVGIGVTSPLSRLHVEQTGNGNYPNVYITNYTNGTLVRSGFAIETGAAYGATDHRGTGYLQFSKAYTNSTWGGTYSAGTTMWGLNANDTINNFMTMVINAVGSNVSSYRGGFRWNITHSPSALSTANELMRLNPVGLGIGTANPMAKAHINGDLIVATRTGTATAIGGWTSDHRATNTSVSSRLSLSSGTLDINADSIPTFATLPNLYNSNGSLTGNRTVQLGESTLEFFREGNNYTPYGLNSNLYHRIGTDTVCRADQDYNYPFEGNMLSLSYSGHRAKFGFGLDPDFYYSPAHVAFFEYAGSEFDPGYRLSYEYSAFGHSLKMSDPDDLDDNITFEFSRADGFIIDREDDGTDFMLFTGAGFSEMKFTNAGIKFDGLLTGETNIGQYIETIPYETNFPTALVGWSTPPLLGSRYLSEIHLGPQLNFSNDTLNVSTVMLSGYATKTVANTTSITTLEPTTATGDSGVSKLKAGQSYRVEASGYYTTDTINTNITISLTLNGATVATTGSVALEVTEGGQFHIEGIVTIYSIGDPGTTFSQGRAEFIHTQGDADVYRMLRTATNSINTAISAGFGLQAAWTTASTANSLTCTNYIVEQLTAE